MRKEKKMKPTYQIVIESNGDTTTAKMIVNGKGIKTSTTQRNPSDKPNWHIGAQVAFDRLWERQEKPGKQKNDWVFAVGDRVVYVGDHPVLNGKSGRIVDVNEGDCGVEFDENIRNHSCAGRAKDGHGFWCLPSVLRHEKPTKQAVKEVKRNAKVGDWVRIVKKEGKDGEPYKQGDVSQVTDVLFAGVVWLSCGCLVIPREYVVLEGYKPGRDA